MSTKATTAIRLPCGISNGRVAVPRCGRTLRPPYPHYVAGRIHSLPHRIRSLKRHTAVKAADLELPPAPGKADGSFDLGLAVLLAGCAFEAYNNPVGVTDDCQEFSSNGTETIFTDRDYLRQRLVGHLKLNLKRATKLAGRDAFGTADPLCCVTCGPGTYKTSVAFNTTQPEWDENCTMFIRSIEEEQLVLKVVDEDTLSSDDNLGFAVISLKSVCDGQLHELVVPLEGSENGATLEITAEFTPIEKVKWVTPSEAPPNKESAAEAENAAEWKQLAEMAGKTVEDFFTNVCFVENKATDTQLWLMRNTAQRKAVISFRGTEVVKAKDVVTDLVLSPRLLDSDKADAISEKVKGKAGEAALNKLEGEQWWDATDDIFTTEEREGVTKALQEEAWVHGGFLDAFDSVKARALEALEEVLTQGGGGGGWTVYVTGHSLGGALATLCAYDLATHKEWKGSAPKIVMYNYGSPRVGNAAFTDLYDMAVPDSWRVANDKDIVTKVPRYFGFCHVSHGMEINHEMSKISLTDEGEADEGKLADAAVPVLAGQLVKPQPKSTVQSHFGKLKGLIGKEVDFFSSIFDGSGAKEHSGEFYVDALRRVTAASAKTPTA